MGTSTRFDFSGLLTKGVILLVIYFLLSGFAFWNNQTMILFIVVAGIMVLK